MFPRMQAYRKEPPFCTLIVGLAGTGNQTWATCVARSGTNRSAINYDFPPAAIVWLPGAILRPYNNIPSMSVTAAACCSKFDSSPLFRSLGLLLGIAPSPEIERQNS
jgi:hypothetical protein